MTVTKPNRYRVSSKFPVIKFVICVFFLSIVINIVRNITNNAITLNVILGLTVETVIILALLYFIQTRKQIDYDDIKQVLYLVDVRKQVEIEVPVERIDKILYSEIGIRGKGSYIIVYRDFHNQTKKIRLFPILFDNSIDTIENDTKLKNPEVTTKNWDLSLFNFPIKKKL
jgi:hypothetical protein